MDDSDKPRYVSRKQVYGETHWITHCSLHGKTITADGHCVECQNRFKTEED
jgi:hypothetical protein